MEARRFYFGDGALQVGKADVIFDLWQFEDAWRENVGVLLQQINKVAAVYVCNKLKLSAFKYILHCWQYLAQMLLTTDIALAKGSVVVAEISKRLY